MTNRTTTWQLDPEHTMVEFAVKHMMFTTVRGRLPLVDGEVRLDAEDPERSSVEVELDATGIDTGSEDRDTHLRSADFLDVEDHPVLTFRSTRVEAAAIEEGERFTVVGDLTIRGRSVEVELEVEFQGTGPDPWGGERAGFRATTEIDRRDWGLEWNQALETGGVLVGNAVRIEIEAQAVKQEAARAA